VLYWSLCNSDLDTLLFCGGSMALDGEGPRAVWAEGLKYILTGLKTVAYFQPDQPLQVFLQEGGVLRTKYLTITITGLLHTGHTTPQKVDPSCLVSASSSSSSLHSFWFSVSESRLTRAKQIFSGTFNPLILSLFILQMPYERKGNIHPTLGLETGEAFSESVII